MRTAYEEAGVSDLSPLVELLDETPGPGRPARSSDPRPALSMPGYDYGWISLDARRIGFDFYFRDDYPEPVTEYILTDIAPGSQDWPATPSRRPPGPDTAGPCACKQPNPSRHVCSPGSPPRALASLTAGFLWPADGAADHHRMPANPVTFLDWYPEWLTGQVPR